MIGTYLVHGCLHLFMVQVDDRLFGTGWYMVGCTCLWYRLMKGCLVQVGAWLVALVYGTC
jgi:hypothetical protein